MSADNWGICPCCKVQARAKQERAFQKAVDAYGKVPAAEYEQLQTIAREPIALEATLREDYESFISEEGRFYISYKGHCQRCDFGKDFKIDEQLDLS